MGNLPALVKREFARLARQRATAGTDIKWLRDVGVSVGAGVGAAKLLGHLSALTLEDVLMVGACSAVAFGLLELGRIAWRRFSVVPFEMYNEVQQQLRRQQTADELQAIADRLQERHAWALHNIINHPPPPEISTASIGSQIVGLGEQLMSWCGEVHGILVAAGATATTVAHFDDVVEYDVKRGVLYFDLGMAKLARLRDIIDDYVSKSNRARDASVNNTASYTH